MSERAFMASKLDKPSPLSDDSCVAASSENPRRWNIVMNEAIVAILAGSVWLCGSWQKGKGFRGNIELGWHKARQLRSAINRL